MALYTLKTGMSSVDADENKPTDTKCDGLNKEVPKFDQLRDLVPDMTEATSVVCIADKAQSVRGNRDGSSKGKISSCIRIKRKRLEHQVLKRTKSHQRNITKGLEASLDKSPSADMFKTISYKASAKATKK